MTLVSGSRLGPYEILSPIGAGGMGEVYRARDPRLGRDVAIKVLPASFSTDADRLRRFEQEARAAGILNHPNITASSISASDEGASYIVRRSCSRGRRCGSAGPAACRPGKAIDNAGQSRTGSPPRTRKGSSTGT